MAQARIAFMKLIVENVPRAKEFYERAFGFAQTNAFDTPDFEEVMLQQDGNEFLLMLLAYKSRAYPDASSHGPTGFVCTDLEASVHKALSAGATLKLAPKDVGPTRVAFVADPEGHEIELIQFV